MYKKHVKITGSYKEKQTQDSREKEFFKVRKVVVVENQNLAALFRRDPELGSLIIHIEDTTEPLTPGLSFSEYPPSN